MKLNLSPNLKDADGFYDALIKAHLELSKEESDALNARLILILANHIGDPAILNQALQTASLAADPK
ncbi:MAG: DUF2783 domain-containing protein [Pseudomonadota bacterium]